MTPRHGSTAGGVQRQYRREAARYDRRWAGYLDRTLGPTLAVLAQAPPGRLLDVGCGTGVLLAELSRREPDAPLAGIDVSSEMLAVAQDRLDGRVPLLLGDVHRLPLATASLDTVVTASAFHHWREPERALGEIARVLKPGGRLVLTDWCADYPLLNVFSRLLRLKDPSHHRSYTEGELRRLLERAGLEPVESRRYRAGWLWGMMTLTAIRAG